MTDCHATNGTWCRPTSSDRSRSGGSGVPSSTRSSAARDSGSSSWRLMSEVIGRCMYSMAIFGVQAPDSGNMDLLAHGATEAQKERWLWPNLRGEISSAFALTEPFFAGADPTVIGTTAHQDGDEWVINGHKWFITNASVADIVLVFAETNPEGRPHRHASVFVVPTDTPGLEIVRDIAHDGAPRRGVRASRQPRRARAPRLPRARRPSDRPAGRRFRARPATARRRSHPPRDAVARAGPTVTRHHVRAGGVPAPRTGSCWPATRWCRTTWPLSHTEIQAARLLTFQTAWKIDKHGAAAVRADLGMVKAHVSKVVLTVLDRTIQVCGALGLLGRPAGRVLVSRERASGPIGDGPDELHKSVLARTLLKRYQPVDGWPSEHIPSRRPAAEAKWAELSRLAGVPESAHDPSEH